MTYAHPSLCKQVLRQWGKVAALSPALVQFVPVVPMLYHFSAKNEGVLFKQCTIIWLDRLE